MDVAVFFCESLGWRACRRKERFDDQCLGNLILTIV